VRIFLDTSVLLSACGSDIGASRAIFRLAPSQRWKLIVTPYVIQEVSRNFDKVPGDAEAVWSRLRNELVILRDVITLDRPSLFSVSKDRPILYSALAWADILLTIDRGDFGDLMGGKFYDLPISKPRDFLNHERDLGRI